MFKFRKERLDKENPLGKGQFGGVYPYKKGPNDSKWAVKRLKVDSVKELLGCLPEIVLGFSCDHPCIVPVKGYSIQAEKSKFYVHLKLPRMVGGSLMKELERRKQKNLYYSESELVKHFYCLLSAVEYLHNKKIFHGDIKNNNILLDDKGNLKLADIGSAKYVPDEDLYNPLTGAHGAAKYRAPEIIPHERALGEYNLLSEEEKKNFPMDNILKKDGLFLADSWSIGLAMLEMCKLKPISLRPYDPFPIIEETLQKEIQEPRNRYQASLIEIIFGLLKINPTERLKVSIAKALLEERFEHIITKDLIASLGLQKQSQQEALNISDHLESFIEKKNQIMKMFEDDKRAKEAKLDSLQESIEKLQDRLKVLNLDIEKIQLRKNQEGTNILKQEDQGLPQKLSNQSDQKVEEQKAEEKLQNVKIYRTSLAKVANELNKKWNQWFEIRGQKHLLIRLKPGKILDDQVLKDVTGDIVKECSTENIWKDLDQLEMHLNGNFVEQSNITDEGIKAFASQLGPRLVAIKTLTLDMDNWAKVTNAGLKELAHQFGTSLANIENLNLYMGDWSEITDEGLKELAHQFGPSLQNIRHLELNMTRWNQITDAGIKDFSHQFGSRLENIEYLQLRIASWKKVTDEGLQEFARCLGPKFANLKHLELNMALCNQITDKGLKELASQIGPKLANFEHLCLDMTYWSKITDEGLKVLATQFEPRLANIRYFNLAMFGWHQITDEGLKFLSSQLLPQLASVQHLQLSIGGWTKITDEGFKLFASQFGPQFANIEILHLNLYNLKITTASLNILADQIAKNLPKLKELALRLDYCPLITDDMKQNLRNQFKDIHKVDIY